MQHSFFDRIYIAFLLILLVSFSVIILYTSSATRSSLLAERSESLTNQARLIASQTITGYLTGEYDTDDLTVLFQYYSQTLGADIWYIDASGRIVATSTYDVTTNLPNGETDSTEVGNTALYRIRSNIPSSIYSLDPMYQINENFSVIGNFFDIYDSEMISLNVPVSISILNDAGQIVNYENHGALLLHSSATLLTNRFRSIYSIIFIPCLVIIAIAFVFLGIISKKIIQPVKKLSSVANEYSKGNFDVETGIESKDEVGHLAKSMEYMAAELSKLEDYRRDFVSNISHDFRSPLTSINGYVQAMLDGTIPPEKQERYLKIVLNETKRLTKLTQGLLDLSHLESFGPYLKLKEFDIIDVIRNTMNTFEMKCTDKNISIFLNNHSEKTIVVADKTKIQQVIYNLIDNAIKFTPSGKMIYVTIQDKGDKLSISIKDEGIGMTEEVQKKIWTRFYKGDPSRGKDKQGTGLGLAITREIIKAHNETIDVISSEGSGSEFIFTLPRQMETSTGTSKLTDTSDILYESAKLNRPDEKR